LPDLADRADEIALLFLAFHVEVRMRFGVHLRVLLLGIGALGACGDDIGPAMEQGAPPRLVIPNPPGDTIGLAPGESAALPVRLLSAGGAAIANAAISWKLLAGDAGTGGATLEVTTSATDAGGASENHLTAGPVRVDFRVAVEAGDAPRATFYVNVSERGFTTIDVTPDHAGTRGDVGRIELRAFRDGKPCAEIDPAQVVESTLAPRAVTAFGMPAEWAMFAAGEPYTIAAWAIHAQSGRAVGFGCAPITGDQVQPGDLALRVAVADRALALGAAAVATSLDLTPAAAAESAAGLDRPWRALACPAGAGQLALDWIVDAVAGDGALDGVTVNPTGAAGAIQAARGALGGDGCRAVTKGGGPSLDAALDDAIARGPFPEASARIALASARAPLLGALPLASTLTPAGGNHVRHQLVSAKVGAVVVDLAASARPVIDAGAVWSYEPATAVLGLAAHGFTARLGSALGQGFAAGPLKTAGLDGEATMLGTAMFGSARNAAGTVTGCAEIDDVVCAAAGLASGCTSTACSAAASGLDPALTGWWRALDGAGIDLTLTGTAHASDPDGDLVIDAVPGGLWTAQLATTGLGTIATTGTWVATPLTP
jgi:hypothetical protein